MDKWNEVKTKWLFSEVESLGYGVSVKVRELETFSCRNVTQFLFSDLTN